VKMVSSSSTVLRGVSTASASNASAIASRFPVRDRARQCAWAASVRSVRQSPQSHERCSRNVERGEQSRRAQDSDRVR
jgi:hypothetical protein